MKNNCEQNIIVKHASEIRILANSLLEMQKYGQLSPQTIKLLETMAEG